MENKYNSTMDFHGDHMCIRYDIYEVKDENLFNQILDEWVEFFLKNS